MRERFERFDKYMKLKGLNDNQVTNECGLSQGLLGQARTGKSDLGAKSIDKILNVYQDLNKVWLLTGEGDMLSSSSSAQPQPSVKNEHVADDEAYKVPLVPVSALAGSLNDFSLSVKRDDCETVISPIKDIDMAIKISGDSMEPEYPSDSQVFVKKINERAFLEWGRVYVLNTCNGIVIKRLMPTNDPNTVLCESINPKYPPFEVNLENVNGVYRVMMCMSFK